MLFHPKNKKFLKIITAIFAVIVIIGMLVLYFPVFIHGI
jgi:preprotein translocase subunit SecG